MKSAWRICAATTILCWGITFAGPERALAAPGDHSNVEHGLWSQLTPSGPLPPPRSEASAVYDAVNGRMIVFGGAGPLGDTWALNLVGPLTWTNLNPAPSPTARRAATLVFDPVRDRIILFGGDDGSFRNDVWQLNLTGVPSWTPIAPIGGLPPGRMWAVGAYDPAGDRILYYGGYQTVPLADVWALSLSGTPAWTQLVTGPPVPPARWGGVGAYDPFEERLVVAMGNSPSGYVNDAWAFSPAEPPAWSLLTPLGAPPSPRFLGSGVYDLSRNRLLMYGGYPPGENEVWELSFADGTAWTLLAPAGTAPPGRRLHVSVYDPIGHRMVAFGGFGQNNDTWALNFTDPGTGSPQVVGFAPGGGPAGTPVTILGLRFDTATLVEFAGVASPILTQSYSAITTTVPAGATTGPIRVTNPNGAGESEGDFIVGPAPTVLSATPDSGKARTVVRITGTDFAGASRVSFGGVGNAVFQVLEDSVIVATVDTFATTGPIHVTTITGTGVSGFNFRILPFRAGPKIVAVRDVPRDQGGKVIVAWENSDLDVPWRRIITRYRVWRQADWTAAAPEGAIMPGRALFSSLPEHGALADVFWESIAEIPAAFLTGYAYTAATPSDSTADGDGQTLFFVQALTSDPLTFHASNIEGGHSVDNLSPPQPAPFTAEYLTYQVSLHWGRSRAPDLREFRLYRGTGSEFPIEPATLVAATRETTYVDPVPGSWGYSYKLVAVDLHGNVSRVALVSPDVPVAALASLVSAHGDADRIRLVWYSGGNPGVPVTIHRRGLASGWTQVAEAQSDGSGYIRYEDTEIQAGLRYAYRVGIWDGDEEVFSAETWVTAESPRFALHGPWPNPSTAGRFSVAFELPSMESASLELWDLAGRRVERVDAGVRGRGRHVAEFGARARLAPGVYFLRFDHAGETISRRVVVLE